MLRLIPILCAQILCALLLAVLPAGIGETAVAQRVSPIAQRQVGALAEPARLCGTNSSRSRRCFFGNRECHRAGHSKADCDRAIAICHSCISNMVACARVAANSCADCTEHYSTCMQPWVALIE